MNQQKKIVFNIIFIIFFFYSLSENVKLSFWNKKKHLIINMMNGKWMFIIVEHLQLYY